MSWLDFSIYALIGIVYVILLICKKFIPSTGIPIEFPFFPLYGYNMFFFVAELPSFGNYRINVQ